MYSYAPRFRLRVWLSARCEYTVSTDTTTVQRLCMGRAQPRDTVWSSEAQARQWPVASARRFAGVLRGQTGGSPGLRHSPREVLSPNPYLSYI
jgi:hypothetical protein